MQPCLCTPHCPNMPDAATDRFTHSEAALTLLSCAAAQRRDNQDHTVEDSPLDYQAACNTPDPALCPTS